MSAPLLSEIRPRAAAALAPTSDVEPDVLIDVVDSLTPPALMLDWGDPWLVPKTVMSGSSGLWEATFVVWAVASRVEPGPGIETLESLVGYVVARLEADAGSWPVATSVAPRVLTIGGVPYLAARLEYRLRVGVAYVVPTQLEEVS